MAAARANLVYELSSTVGAGNFILLGLNGHQRFSGAFGTGSTPDVFTYFISNRDAPEWERGTGHCSAVGTLIRDTVKEGTNGTSPVIFSVGTKDVTNDVPADETIPAGKHWSIEEFYAIKSTTHLQVSMKASGLVLYSPVTQTNLRVLPGAVPTGLVCDLANVGENGRDQSSAFVFGDEVHFYFTQVAGSTVKTIASKTGPYAVNGNSILGPVVPSGTHWAYGFSWMMSDADNFVHDSHQADEGTRGTFNGYIVGTTLHLSGSVTGVALVVGNKISGSTTLLNTLLVSGSGSTWTVNKSQTVGSVGSPVALTSTTPYGFTFEVVCDEVKFTNDLLLNMTDNLDIPNTVGPGTPYSMSYAQWIPTHAFEIGVYADAEISTTDAGDEFTGAFNVSWTPVTYPFAGNSKNLSVYSFGFRQPAAQNVYFRFRQTTDRALVLTYINGNGAVAEQATTMWFDGYRVKT